MPNLTISSESASVDMWNIGEDRDERDGDTDVFDSPSFDSDEAYLAGMTESHTSSVSGTATGFRLSDQSGYSNDPVTALAEWVQKAMAFVNGQQGTGYTFTHDERDYTSNGVIVSFGWTRNSGAKFEVDWNLTYRIGEGVMTDGPIDVGAASPSSTWTLGGTDLQHPVQYREEKRQQFKPIEMLYADGPEQNVLESKAGARRTININGKHTGTVAERKSFDDTMTSYMGNDTTVTYQSAFPGHSIDVMVNRYESILEAGATDQGEYQLELIEGQTT